MFPPISITFSAPAFSFLLYETCKSRFSQVGFLLGEIVHKETTSITDNDQQQVMVQKLIKINSVLPCPENYFCNGFVDCDKVQKFLGDQMKNVVSWYKFQSYDTFKFTQKSLLVHNKLKDLFNISSELFTCCVLFTERSSNLATHIYSQIFVRHNDKKIDKLKMHIPNLSEPNNTYKNCEPASEVFNEILSNLKGDIKNSRGVVAVSEIENAVQNHINGTVKELEAAEKKLYDLENEVRQLLMEADNNASIEPIRKKSAKMDITEDSEDIQAVMDVENYPTNSTQTWDNDLGDHEPSPKLHNENGTPKKCRNRRIDNGDSCSSTDKNSIEIDDKDSSDNEVVQCPPEEAAPKESPKLQKRNLKTNRQKSLNSDADSKSEEKFQSPTSRGRGRGKRGKK